MNSAERFVTLVVGIVAIIGALAAVLRVLLKISWDLGQLVQRFGDHITDATKIHGDQETRLREIEKRGR